MKRKAGQDIEIDNTLNAGVGKRIRSLRRILNISSPDLAEKLSISYQQLYKYETGKNNISLNMLAKIGNVFEESISDFIIPSTGQESVSRLVEVLVNLEKDNPSSKEFQEIKDLCDFLLRSGSKDVKAATVNLIEALQELASNSVDNMHSD